MKINYYLIVAGVVILLAVAGYNYFSKPEEIVINPEALQGIQTGNAPWGVQTETLRPRLEAIGLPALAEEGAVLHTHQHLDISINGAKLNIPTDIGINEEEKFISQIHTHDLTGIIHVESPVVKDFTLGQFFDIWGVRFTDTCLGGYCAEEGKELKMYVNGQRADGNFRRRELKDHEEIVITYGSAQDEPSPIPSSYQFPPNY